MLQKLKKHYKDIAAFSFFLLFIPLFFYNLGGYSLVDFDEAWYADIARNILKYKSPILLHFNGWPYLDHPPFGFYFISLSFIIFGVNEFSARFFSAVFGFLTLPLLYIIGKKLFNRTVGLISSIVLVSCVWFIFRARSGNLDSIFLFFYLLSLFIGIKIKDNRKYIYLFAIALGILLLIKTLIGITVLIPVVIYLLLNKTKTPRKEALGAFCIFIILLTPWFFTNFWFYRFTFLNKVISVGLRSAYKIPLNLEKALISHTFVYLHYGIWKWYLPALVSALGSLFFIKKGKNIIPIYFLIVVLLYSFLTNSATEIWHLIILYPFVGLIIGFFSYSASDFLINLIAKFLLNWHLNKKVYAIYKKYASYSLYSLILVVTFVIAVYQIDKFLPQIKFYDKGVSDIAFTSTAAKGRPEQLYSDSDDLFPAAIFYSGKNLKLVRWEKPPKNILGGFIKYNTGPYLLLTEMWKLDLNKTSPSKYEIIAQKNGYVLIKPR